MLSLCQKGALADIKSCWPQLGGNTKPTRIRVLDLPFTAVEWVTPTEMPAWNASSDNWMVWERSPLARERSLFGYWDDADDAEIAAAAAGGDAPAASANTEGQPQSEPVFSSKCPSAGLVYRHHDDEMYHLLPPSAICFLSRQSQSDLF